MGPTVTGVGVCLPGVLLKTAVPLPPAPWAGGYKKWVGFQGRLLQVMGQISVYV